MAGAMREGVGERTPRRGWVVLAVVAWVLFAGQVVAVPILLFNRLFVDWVAMGAWLRTPWGHLEDRTPPPGPPQLGEGRARQLAIAAGVCAAASSLALAVQFVQSYG